MFDLPTYCFACIQEAIKHMHVTYCGVYLILLSSIHIYSVLKPDKPHINPSVSERVFPRMYTAVSNSPRSFVPNDLSLSYFNS